MDMFSHWPNELLGAGWEELNASQRPSPWWAVAQWWPATICFSKHGCLWRYTVPTCTNYNYFLFMHFKPIDSCSHLPSVLATAILLPECWMAGDCGWIVPTILSPWWDHSKQAHGKTKAKPVSKKHKCTFSQTNCPSSTSIAPLSNNISLAQENRRKGFA